MKILPTSIFPLALALFASGLTMAQTNTFPTTGNAGVGTTSPSYPFQVSGSGSDLIGVIGSGASRGGIYVQNTNANAQATIYTDNNRGSFASYCGFFSGGSTNALGNIFGLARADRGFFIADGTSNLGLGIGTLTAQPLVLGTNNAERLRIDAAGNVGIGTGSPQNTLHVAGTVRADGTIYPYGNIQGMADNTCLAWDAFGSMRMGFSKKSGFYPKLAYAAGAVFAISQSSAGDIGATNTFTDRLIIDANGNVGIGTSNPGTSRLAVEGVITSRKVVVTQVNPFPDYVFQPGYRLPSLASLSKFIQIHHHLPGFPSADSVARSGIDIGSGQEALLQHLEELTLYVIQQDRQIRQLEDQNRRQKDEIQQLKEQEIRIRKLEKRIEKM